MTLRIFTERIPIFIRFYIQSNNLFQIHSPFISGLIKTVFDSDRLYHDFTIIDQCWRQIMADSSDIPECDFSRLHQQANKRVCDFAAKAISKPAHYELLYRLSYFLKPQHCLELGSGLGLSGLALALANRGHNVLSIEGNNYFTNYCKKIFEKFNIQNIEVIHLPFSEFLDGADLGLYDLVFLDGDHTYASTIAYSKAILKSTPANSVLVLDDIHWSREMYRAWKELIRCPEVRCSVETQRLGFLFKSPEITKGHFTYLPYWLKPWNLGLFARSSQPG